MNTANIDLRPRISWSAIFAGAFVGLGLAFLLHLFSVAIGLSAYASTPDGVKEILAGGVLGLLIGVIISMGAAGLVSGYLGRFYDCCCNGGVIYGFLTWSLVLLLSTIFLMPLTHYTMAYKMNLSSSVMTQPMTQMANDKMSAVSQAAGGDSKNLATPKNKPMMQQSHLATPKGIEMLACNAWLVFALFFAGALSSCIGACMGMRCKRDMEAHHHS